MANQILNSQYGTSYNEYSDNTFKIHLKAGQTLYMNNSMFNFARNCFNLQLNLDNFNVNYDNVTSMSYAFANCYNLTGSPKCGDKATDMLNTYQECYNITGSPVCGLNVKEMYRAYDNCYSLTGQPVCGNNVTSLVYTYQNCYSLTGSPVCGPNVIDMDQAFYYCNNLTGSPVCGPNVEDMSCTYTRCSNLTGSPVCGPNVTDMYFTYSGCSNLTGSPVCGIKVTDMNRAYADCFNLTGSPVCGPNVVDMRGAYENCRNLSGNLYIQSDIIENTEDMFYGHNYQNIINIYVNAGTTSNSTLYSQGAGCGSWTLDTANNRYYNAVSNIYVYYGNIPTPSYNNMDIVYLNTRDELNNALNSKSSNYVGYILNEGGGTYWKNLYIVNPSSDGNVFDVSDYTTSKMYELNSYAEVISAIRSQDNDGKYYCYLNNNCFYKIYKAVYRSDANVVNTINPIDYFYINTNSTDRYNYYYAESSVRCPVSGCKKVQYPGIIKPAGEGYVCCIKCGTSFSY